MKQIYGSIRKTTEFDILKKLGKDQSAAPAARRDVRSSLFCSLKIALVFLLACLSEGGMIRTDRAALRFDQSKLFGLETSYYPQL
jgi:hypothetical protein